MEHEHKNETTPLNPSSSNVSGVSNTTGGGAGEVESSSSNSKTIKYEELMKRGKECMLNKELINAADYFLSACTELSTNCGNDAVECIFPLYQLGLARFMIYESNIADSTPGIIKQDLSESLESAFQYITQAKNLSDKYSIRNHETVNILTNLGDILVKKDLHDDALQSYLSAVELIEKIDPKGAIAADLYFKICLFLERQGKFEEAITYCEKDLFLCSSLIVKLKETSNALKARSKNIDRATEEFKSKLAYLSQKLSNKTKDCKSMNDATDEGTQPKKEKV